MTSAWAWSRGGNRVLAIPLSLLYIRGREYDRAAGVTIYTCGEDHNDLAFPAPLTYTLCTYNDRMLTSDKKSSLAVEEV